MTVVHLFVNLKINKIEHVEPVQHQLKMNTSLLLATSVTSIFTPKYDCTLKVPLQ